MKYNILITGVAGFVGEEISHYFSDKSKYNIIGLDKNERDYISNDKFVKCDLVLDDDKLSKLFSELKPDVVIHCAAKILETQNKKMVWETNYNASKKLIDLCIQFKVKKFIFISTFSIFQKNYDKAIDENEPPSYRTLYGKTKFLAEKFLLESAFSGDICILRCPIILGKKRSYRFGILFGLIKDNYNIPWIGRGDNKISFVHVSDICKAIELFFNKQGKYLFNIAAENNDTLIHIIYRLIKKVSSKSKIVHFNSFIGNILFDIVSFLHLIPYNNYHKKMFNYNVILDTKKIRSVLNWKPDYSVEQMFEENFNYFKKQGIKKTTSWSKKSAKEGLIGILKRLI